MASLFPAVSRPLTLATDLDGTFLGGSPQDRNRLYQLIHSNRESFRLLYVTGRSYPNVKPLFEQFGLPMPDCLICDVGTSIHAYDGSCFSARIQSEIASVWGEGHLIVESAIDHIDDLEKQALTGPYRRSYFYTSEASAVTGKQIVEDLGFDGLISDSKYFDVLPKGVNKGTTLLRIVHEMKLDPSSLLVAGDTFNDLSMLSCGLPSVLVGNAEAGLREAVQGLATVYIAQRSGAGGILEAIERHPLFNRL